MKVHDKVHHLQRKVTPNFVHNELLAINNLDTRSFTRGDCLVNLSIVFCVERVGHTGQQTTHKSTRFFPNCQRTSTLLKVVNRLFMAHSPVVWGT